jgi:hypothetical protein
VSARTENLAKNSSYRDDHEAIEGMLPPALLVDATEHAHRGVENHFARSMIQPSGTVLKGRDGETTITEPRMQGAGQTFWTAAIATLCY